MTPPNDGFRPFPVPHWSTTTRGGTRVSCGGCCLPIPLGCLATVVAAAAPVLVGAVRRGRARRSR